MKRFPKIILGLFGALVLLLLAAAALTQTQLFRDWLRNKIIAAGREKLNGRLALGRIEGNLISQFKISNLTITRDGKTVVRVPRLEFGFSPRELWERRVLINQLLIDSPAIHLRQNPDSSWNVQNLIVTDTTAIWPIVLPTIRIRNGEVNISPLDTASFFYRRTVQNLNAELLVEYTTPQTVLDLRRLAFSITNFPVAVSEINAHIVQTADAVQIDNLQITAGGSTVTGNLRVRDFKRPIYRLQLAATPLQLDDWHTLFPQLSTQGPLEANLHCTGNWDSVLVDLDLKHEAGEGRLIAYARRDSGRVGYTLDADIRRADLARLLPERGPHSRLNLSLRAQGDRLSLDSLQAMLRLTADSSRLGNYAISNFILEGAVRDNGLHADLQLQTPAGEITGFSQVRDLSGTQDFDMSLNVKRLNLAAFVYDTTLISNLNFAAALKGRHLNLNTLEAAGTFDLQPSRIWEINLAAARGVFRSQAGEMALDTLRLESDLGNFSVDGAFNQKQIHLLHFIAEIDKLELARRMLAADTLHAHGVIGGTAQGIYDSLSVNGGFQLAEVQYNAAHAKNLVGEFGYRRAGLASEATLNAAARSLQLAGAALDSVKLATRYLETFADVAAEIWLNPQNSGVISGRFFLGDTARFEVSRAELAIFDQTWETAADSMWIELGQDEYFFHNLSLRSGPEHFFLDGKLSFSGAEDLRIGLSNLQLARYAKLFGLKEGLHGLMDIEARLNGTASAPRLDGHFLINNGKLSEFAYQNWAGEFKFEDEKLSWSFKLQQNRTDSLTGGGFLPLHFALDGSPVMLYKERPMRIQANAKTLDISFLQAFTSRVKNIRGTLSCDVELEGTPSNMRPGGPIRVYDATFALPEYGTTYHDLLFVVSLASNALDMSKFRVESDKGKLEGNIKISLDHEGRVSGLEGAVFAQNFPLSRTRDLELRIDSDSTRITGDANGLRYAGAVTVKRAIYSLSSMQTGKILEIDEAELRQVLNTNAEEKDSTFTRLLQHVSGELKIRMPRNTWIRGPEINLELNGELDLVQEGEKYLLFGAIDIARGTYELYGKKFTVRSGKLIFQGDIDTAIQIDLLASYVFRQGKEKHEMFVNITGSLSNPQVAFSLDSENATIEQKDAISYILFNAPAQGGGINFAGTASGVVSGLVSQQLSKTLGEGLNLDVIEFGTGENLTPGSVLVGKYITNDLFISVSQDFSSFNSADALRVALELEVLREFFLQATRGGKDEKDTGFDVIWKREWQ